jgi:hypothetical protein
MASQRKSRDTTPEKHAKTGFWYDKSLDFGQEIFLQMGCSEL